MSFLDNLENSLKSLESLEEQNPAEVEHRRRQQKAEVLATAPWADRLKSSAYVSTLLAETVGASRQLRSKIYLAWLETTLRLETRGQFCEIKPTAGGIVAEYRRLCDGAPHSESVDLDGDPKALLQRWLFES